MTTSVKTTEIADQHEAPQHVELASRTDGAAAVAAPPVVNVAVTEHSPLPIPRGIAFACDSLESLDAANRVVVQKLRGWTIGPIDGLDDWFEVRAPDVLQRNISKAFERSAAHLRRLWAVVRALRGTPGVEHAEPLFLIFNPRPARQVDAEAFSMAAARDHFGAWSAPYDPSTELAMRAQEAARDWHLRQQRVPLAWDLWHQRHPDAAPGDSVRVAQLDTGYTAHPGLMGALELTGQSLLLNSLGVQEPDARDDLHVDFRGFLEFPGHGSAVAGVIAARSSPQIPPELQVYGVAPGATVLPIRVGRSAHAFDSGVVGRGILAAIENHADVICVTSGTLVYSGFVHECIRRAHTAGVVVVAAAGDALPGTLFPAALPEVTAVAVSNAAARPWRFSGAGRYVDVSAPGENVWCARASLRKGVEFHFVKPTSSSGIAAGCVAGLAALWLSYHGGRDAISRVYEDHAELVPLAFKYVLTRTAWLPTEFGNEGWFGTGIADASGLIGSPLPSLPELFRFRDIIATQPVPRLTVLPPTLAGDAADSLVSASRLACDATISPNGTVRVDPVDQTPAVVECSRETDTAQELLSQLVGSASIELKDEVLTRVAADRNALLEFQSWRQGHSPYSLVQRLLASSARPLSHLHSDLSGPLELELIARRGEEQSRLTRWRSLVTTSSVTGLQGEASRLAVRPCRLLRVYAFDPSLETTLETAPITQVSIPTPWERVKPGPVGEYLEVVDVDPASGCAYSPVDLNKSRSLAEEGLPPSEGNPQFHQQMVYAVAMNTINRFERALGRCIFWSPIRPSQGDSTEQRCFTNEALDSIGVSDRVWVEHSDFNRDRDVQRLRIYPHALREANAYYSPRKRALLFGYFPASAVDTGRHYPGGMIFTCLSHDIIAHETTHAVLDGMHPYFTEPTNDDVWAFHEAFADIMALLQHFTYPEVLRHQIANSRGNLEANSLLGQLAQQFSEASGQRAALRYALGGWNEKTGLWERRAPDATLLHTTLEPHERGAILIAAVFNAFLALYNDRTADVLSLYTGGTQVLPGRQLHSDVVNRLADEAADTAARVLDICIRALDYMPPVDPTFGEFLRALITADYELSPEQRRNRIAFIDAFRSWGIYPHDVSTLSDDSLRWGGPLPDAPLATWTWGRSQLGAPSEVTDLIHTLSTSYLGDETSDRARLFRRVYDAQLRLAELLMSMQSMLPPGQSLIDGLDLRPGAPAVVVSKPRPVRRYSAQEDLLRTDLALDVVQTIWPDPDDSTGIPLRGGATLIIDLQTADVHTAKVRYIITKRLYRSLPAQPSARNVSENALANRLRRWYQPAHEDYQRLWSDSNESMAELAAIYAAKSRARMEPFAFLHRSEAGAQGNHATDLAGPRGTHERSS